MPNAFGGRDIYGGKVDRGFAEAKLLRITSNRFVQLQVFDLSKDSAETTMDRYRPGVAVSQTVNIGASASTDGIVVTIDTATEPYYVLAGVKITFIRVGKSAVVYTLQDVHRY